jgi:cytochrome c oxidase accessory protein FixG
MDRAPVLLEAPDRVLSTLNRDGSRRWLRPRPERGALWERRRVVAYILMVIFFLIPYVQLNGKPLILLDLPRRTFALFGATFLPTDTVLFMLLFVSVLIAIFLVTALAGRVWCGWACPQTVYTEWLFRPVEYWIEGGPAGTRALDERGRLHWRRVLKWGVFAALAVFLAHTFLAYFVGVTELARWVRQSPIHHPTSFLVMLGTTALVFFDFAYFREQTCLVACPYGRLQSVLLDRSSIIVAYDAARGEPRRKGKAREGAGDCVDCARCTIVCPTGIDIRDGLQMECIHCTQCIDACNDVMARIGKPLGLIRYSTRNALERTRTRLLRPRVVLYPLALCLTTGAFLYLLVTKADTDVTILRAPGAAYTAQPDGSITNHVLLKITNRGEQRRVYRFAIEGAPGATLIAPQNPFPVAAGKTQTTTAFITLPSIVARTGEMPVLFRIRDDAGYEGTVPYELVGPSGEE